MIMKMPVHSNGAHVPILSRRKRLCMSLRTTMLLISGTVEYQSLRRDFGHLSTLNPSGWTTPPGMTTMGSVTSLQPVKTRMVSIFGQPNCNCFLLSKLTRYTHIQIVSPRYIACNFPSVPLVPLSPRSRTTRISVRVNKWGSSSVTVEKPIRRCSSFSYLPDGSGLDSTSRSRITSSVHPSSPYISHELYSHVRHPPCNALPRLFCPRHIQAYFHPRS